MMAETRRPGAGRFHYAWVVAAVTFVVLLVSAGIRATPGVLMVPLEREFGWTRATISLAISVNLVLYGLMGPFAAALMERLGVRRTMLIALTALTVGVGLTTLMTRPWQLVLLWGVVVGGGTGMGALVLGAVVVNRWFQESRGLVMGVLTASTATGQLVFLPALAWLAEHRGWRSSVEVVAGAALVAIPLVLLLMRERPRDLGLRPYGASGDGDVAPPAPQPPLAALARGVASRDFWLLAATFFICGASTNGLIGTHFIPAAHDHGIPEVTAAGLLAVMGICDLLGTTLSGWLSDRWDSRRLLAWYYALRGLSLIFLPYAFAGSHASLAVFALFYGLDWIATVPPTVRLTSDAFGKENVGVMFGWIVAGHQLGAAFAAGGAGAIRTWMGDYHVAFVASGAMCLLASVLALGVGRARGVRIGAGASPSPWRREMEMAAAAGPERLALEFLGRVWGPAHELDAIDELMTEDYAITTGGTRIEGRDAFKAWVRDFQSVLGDARTDSVEAFANASGDRIVSRWVCSGVNRGILGLPADGRRVSFTGIAIWRVRDGRLAECWVERAAWELYRELAG